MPQFRQRAPADDDSIGVQLTCVDFIGLDGGWDVSVGTRSPVGTIGQTGSILVPHETTPIASASRETSGGGHGREYRCRRRPRAATDASFGGATLLSGPQTRIKTADCSPDEWFSSAGKYDISGRYRQRDARYRRITVIEGVRMSTWIQSCSVAFVSKTHH